MLGHDASGYGSVKYGQTVDYVLALRVVLADGTVLDARDVALDGPEWRALVAQAPALADVRTSCRGSGAARSTRPCGRSRTRWTPAAS